MSSVSGVFLNSETWANALNTLAAAIPEISDDQPESADKRSDLIQSLLSAVRGVIAKSSAPPGTDFGKVMCAYAAALAGSSKSKPIGSRLAKATVEVVLLSDAALTRRPILAFDQALVDALLQVRKSMPDRRWSPPASKAIGSIMTKMADIVIGFAKEGVAANRLFGALEALGGSREAALKLTRNIPSQIEGMPSTVVTLLTEGYLPDRDPGTLKETEEAMLATVLLRADELCRAFPENKDPFASEGISMRSLAATLVTEVQALARRRGLETEGRPGDIVPYSPLLHRFVKEVAGLQPQVRILIPGVIRREEGRSAEVIVHAIVEALDS